MPDRVPVRFALIDELLRRFGAALRGAQLYAPGHPLVNRNIAAFLDVIDRLLGQLPSVTVALVADEVVVCDTPAPRGAQSLGDFLVKLRSRGVERITIERGVSADELIDLIAALNRRLELRAVDDAPPWPEMPHVRIGQVRVEQRVETSLADMVTIRRLYKQATSAACAS